MHHGKTILIHWHVLSADDAHQSVRQILQGKKLSPRKVMMDLRARMKEKGPLMVKNGRDFNDNRSLAERLYFRGRVMGMYNM